MRTAGEERALLPPRPALGRRCWRPKSPLGAQALPPPDLAASPRCLRRFSRITSAEPCCLVPRKSQPAGGGIPGCRAPARWPGSGGSEGVKSSQHVSGEAVPSFMYPALLLLAGVWKAPSAMMPWATSFLLELLLHCCLGHSSLTGAPRIYLTYKELLETRTARPFSFTFNTSDYRILLMDQDQERLYLGGTRLPGGPGSPQHQQGATHYETKGKRLKTWEAQKHGDGGLPTSLTASFLLQIHWPALPSHQHECRLAGKGLRGECFNYIRLMQPLNRTHLYACGTGAYHPVCALINRGWRSEVSRKVIQGFHSLQEYLFRMVPRSLEPGKGKCPYDPRQHSMAVLVNNTLYAGVHVDFMGTDAALFRTMGPCPAVRTEQHDSRWLYGRVLNGSLKSQRRNKGGVEDVCIGWIVVGLKSKTKAWMGNLWCMVNQNNGLSFFPCPSPDPVFLQAHVIPDSSDHNDDKLYFFFREKALEGAVGPAVLARVGRVCLNDDGGQRSLVNKWTTFLKARLVCSVIGEDGVETFFDELREPLTLRLKILDHSYLQKCIQMLSLLVSLPQVMFFLLPTQDEKHPLLYGVFSTLGSVFRGSAVCVYSMAEIRTVFNGPFAHKEGHNYQWGPYTGRVPYPRPGACPGGTFTPGLRTTREFSDELVTFIRTHPLMYNAVYPLQRRPLLMRTNVPYSFTTLAVDLVDAVDGQYEVLFLGTDQGTVQKVIVLPQEHGVLEELTLEEVEVFRVSEQRAPAPVKTLWISSKRQQLYVSSDMGVSQLSLHRCREYGEACADCCLARDPYCAWDGQRCARYSHTAKRRSRRQDIKHGDPLRQCRGFNAKVEQQLPEQVQYGLEGGSVFLECEPRNPHTSIKWLTQTENSDKRKVLPRDRVLLQTSQGVLLGPVTPADGGLYQCIGTENRFRHTLRRLQLHILPRALLEGAISHQQPPALGICENYWQQLNRDQDTRRGRSSRQPHTRPILWDSEQQANGYRINPRSLNWTRSSPKNSQNYHHHHRSKPWTAHRSPPRS
ncbi:hypothetical protein lerEdw1_005503 [Lerista edwardsae]|nr:hypothetical protein lerEdw1_005503 [Lerista edwardsae]